MAPTRLYDKKNFKARFHLICNGLRHDLKLSSWGVLQKIQHQKNIFSFTLAIACRQTTLVWLDFGARITPNIDLLQVWLEDIKNEKFFKTSVSSTSYRWWRSVAKVGKVEPDSTLSMIAPTPCVTDHRQRCNQNISNFCDMSRQTGWGHRRHLQIIPKPGLIQRLMDDATTRRRTFLSLSQWTWVRSRP